MADDVYQPRPPRSLWPIFLGALVMLALFLGAAKLLLSLAGPAPDEDAARSLERRKAHADLLAEDAKKLGEFAWADRASQKVQIPIELAMRLAADRLAGQPPRPFTQTAQPSAPAPPPEPAASAPDNAAQPPAVP
ncbi:MAG: hypothetical protein N2322_05760 [Terrimicrobiaceae bacterium]|nr:hypothetical protein [Terrimicrobiaceae bacterium]